MKKLSAPLSYLLVVMLSSTMLIAVSCSKDEDIPAYVGVWVAEGQMTLDSVVYDAKDEMSFTKNSFSDLLSIKNPFTQEWVGLIGMKGTLAVSGDKMSFSFTEMGLSSFDGISGEPTGIINYYKKGTAQYNSLLNSSGYMQSFHGEYLISGKELTLVLDMNNDMDYTDPNEVSYYTKH